MKRLITRTFIALAVAAAATTLPATAQQTDIVDTAVAAGSFKTLAAALQAAGAPDAWHLFDLWSHTTPTAIVTTSTRAPPPRTPISFMPSAMTGFTGKSLRWGWWSTPWRTRR